MKKLLLSALVITGLAQAQITITDADVGNLGDAVILGYDTMPGGTMPAGSATAQTWDFTGLNLHWVDTLAFMDPTGTPGDADFPNADFVFGDVDNLGYMIKSSSSLEVDGFYGDPIDAGLVTAIDFEPNIVQMTFPSTYGTTFTSSSTVDSTLEDIFVGTFDSIRIKITVEINSEMDAFGTLQLPGSTQQVIRQRVEQVQTDSIWALIPILGWSLVEDNVETTYIYNFLANGQDFYVLTAEADANGNILSAEYQGGADVVAGVVFQMNPLCYEDDNGYALIQGFGGTGSLSFDWNDGGTGNERFDLEAGNYAVTVSASSGNPSVVNLTLMNPDSISIQVVNVENSSGADGAIEILASGGTLFGQDYFYSWDNGDNSSTITGLAPGEYTVTVFDDNGCTNGETVTVLSDQGNAIAENEEALFNLYPNPSKGMVNVEAKSISEYTILNLAGQTVQVGTFNKGINQLNVEHLPSGTYFVKVTAEHTNAQHKLILK